MHTNPPARWHCLQREQLLTGPRANGDTAGNRVARQIIQRAGLASTGKPGVLDVALDQPSPLQRAADACGDLLQRGACQQKLKERI